MAISMDLSIYVSAVQPLARSSISCRVEGGVGEEEVPAAVAPEGLQTEQGFVAGPAPELARSLEPALRLSAGRLHLPATDRFASPQRGPIVHPLPMFVKVVYLPGHDLSRRPGRQSRQHLLQ